MPKYYVSHLFTIITFMVLFFLSLVIFGEYYASLTMVFSALVSPFVGIAVLNYAYDEGFR